MGDVHQPSTAATPRCSNCDRHYDGAAVLRLAERDTPTRSWSSATRWPAPSPTRSPRPAPRYDLSSLLAHRVGRCDPLEGGEGGAAVARLPGVLVTDSFGATETGAAGTALDFDRPAAGPAFTIHDWVTVLDDDGRRVEPGSGDGGPLARRGHIPLGYYKDAEKTAATFVDRRRRGALGRPRRLGDDRGRRHASPARTRVGVHQHGRREGLPRGGRGGAEGAPGRVRRGRRRRPRRAAGRARRRRRHAARRRAPGARRAAGASVARRSPATRCRASSS